MAPQSPQATRTVIYVLIAVGIVGLVGASLATPPAAAGGDANMTTPFLFATAGTLAFVVAGVLAFRLLRGGGRR